MILIELINLLNFNPPIKTDLTNLFFNIFGKIILLFTYQFFNLKQGICPNYAKITNP